MLCIHVEWAILGGRVRNAGLSVISGNTSLNIACEYCRRAPEWLRLTRRARDTAATMLHHSRHRGESATKTIKFFIAHTVNYVICNNHTRIDWVLLNFTPVIQQNHRQPGRKFEKLFCATDLHTSDGGLCFAQLTGWAVNLSCQNPKPANSEAILFLIS